MENENGHFPDLENPDLDSRTRELGADIGLRFSRNFSRSKIEKYASCIHCDATSFVMVPDIVSYVMTTHK